MKPHGSIVKLQPEKQKTPRSAHKGWTWRFVKAGGIHAQTARKRLNKAFQGLNLQEQIKNWTLTSYQS